MTVDEVRARWGNSQVESITGHDLYVPWWFIRQYGGRVVPLYHPWWVLKDPRGVYAEWVPALGDELLCIGTFETGAHSYIKYYVLLRADGTYATIECSYCDYYPTKIIWAVNNEIPEHVMYLVNKQ